jgi:HD-GYP domain-containing protein (c-di-GMP phosphodiesterase class II)
MLTTAEPLNTNKPAQPRELSSYALVDRLEAAFRQSFAVLDVTRGALERVTPDWPRVDVFRWASLCEHVARRGRPEVIEDHAPLLLLAAPLPPEEMGPSRIAVAVLLTEANPTPAALESAARAFGVDASWLTQWAAGRRVWPAHAALPLATATVESLVAQQSAASMKTQLSEVSGQLLATFEELNLLHQMTEGLSLGRHERELLDQAVDWLAEIISSDCVVARLDSSLINSAPSHTTIAGRYSPIPADGLSEFFDRLGPQAQRRSLVLNHDRTSSPTWTYPEVREVVTAPILSNGETIGWVGALNYRPKRGAYGSGFGAVEGSLLSSVATLIGVHAGNRDLFEQRKQLFESSVYALTSAIDAKDPYTCGHSDRVARVAVRLAKQLGCEAEELNAIYLGGLLHDIGKIGIDDAVLRKPDKLTADEYEQIKLHPALGEQILKGVPQLAHVLPIVRHHHETWDGNGYPDRLATDACPKLARITAVADAIDAMGSDRPYRKGMPIEEVESILRNGAGKQWDPRVIAAYFAVREDVQAICRIEREPHDLDVGSWREGDACSLEETHT